MAKLHIGKKIKEVWKKSRLKGTEFAAAINRDRQVIYDIFKRESIDTELLQQISKVLNHDFFSYYSSEAYVVREPKDKFGYATKEELAQANRELMTLMKSEFSKLREELAFKKEGYKIKPKKNPKK
ncbi:hypothetical protein CNR22_14430 [Sphingobacteriaceae bacterium]|nr:hypothetical protein CNR22_14430 [Sphingobacteriaceae bacterium]